MDLWLFYQCLLQYIYYTCGLMFCLTGWWMSWLIATIESIGAVEMFHLSNTLKEVL